MQMFVLMIKKKQEKESIDSYNKCIIKKNIVVFKFPIRVFLYILIYSFSY